MSTVKLWQTGTLQKLLQLCNCLCRGNLLCTKNRSAHYKFPTPPSPCVFSCLKQFCFAVTSSNLNGGHKGDFPSSFFLQVFLDKHTLLFLTVEQMLHINFRIGHLLWEDKLFTLVLQLSQYIKFHKLQISSCCNKNFAVFPGSQSVLMQDVQGWK